MNQDDLPADLISHCEQKALEAVAADTAGLVRAVLSASGYDKIMAERDIAWASNAGLTTDVLALRAQNAELVAALEEAAHRTQPYSKETQAKIDAALAAEPVSGEDEMTTIENVHKPYREALKAISREYIQTSPPIGDRPIDLRAENEWLREALNLAVSRGCDHCAETIRQARALAAAGHKQGSG